MKTSSCRSGTWSSQYLVPRAVPIFKGKALGTRLDFSGSLVSGWSPGNEPLVKEPEDSGYEIGQAIEAVANCLLFSF